jgi:hypothetical protein
MAGGCGSAAGLAMRRSPSFNGAGDCSATGAASGSPSGCAWIASRSPLSRRLQRGVLEVLDRHVAEHAFLDGARDVGIAGIEPRQGVAQRHRHRFADRHRHREGRGFDGAERRSDVVATPLLNRQRALRDERGEILMPDHCRHQASRYDAEAEGRPRGTLRPVTRHTHLHAHATTHATLQDTTRYDAFSDRHGAPLRRKCDIFSNDLINLAIALIGRAALAERGK